MKHLSHFTPCGRALGGITLIGHRLWAFDMEGSAGKLYCSHTEWLPSVGSGLETHQHFGALAGKRLITLSFLGKTDRDSWHEWWLYDASAMAPGQAGEAVKLASPRRAEVLGSAGLLP
jgi:hypothetical protein